MLFIVVLLIEMTGKENGFGEAVSGIMLFMFLLFPIAWLGNYRYAIARHPVRSIFVFPLFVLVYESFIIFSPFASVYQSSGSIYSGGLGTILFFFTTFFLALAMIEYVIVIVYEILVRNRHSERLERVRRMNRRYNDSSMLGRLFMWGFWFFYFIFYYVSVFTPNSTNFGVDVAWYISLLCVIIGGIIYTMVTAMIVAMFLFEKDDDEKVVVS